MRQKKTFLVLSIVTFISLQIFPLAYGAGFRLEGSNGIVRFAPGETIRKKYDLCQETERWEKITNPNFPLNFIHWQLVTNSGSSDKYMDKRIIGTVKNSSKKEFSEVKIEFTVYDEEGAQIAVVFSNVFDFKPGHIWKFDIPVTSDVGKAELKGLYVPAKELRELEEQRKGKRESFRHSIAVWIRLDSV
jgi:hypothetical protein